MHLHFQKAKDNGSTFMSSCYTYSTNDYDTITITVMGTSKTLLENIISDAESEYKNQHAGKFITIIIFIL